MQDHGQRQRGDFSILPGGTTRELPRLRFSLRMMGLLKVIVELFERYHGIF